MRGSLMKNIVITFLIILFTVPVADAVVILNHMMTKDLLGDTSCATPTPHYTFTLEDETAYSWVQVSGAVPGDIVKWFFYSPDLTLFEQCSFNSPPFPPALDCTWGWFDIKNSLKTVNPGNWHVDVYYNDVYQYTENFTISSCPAVTLYGDDAEETERLRYFRDEILRKTPGGQAIITLYYELAPAIVQIMKEDEEFKTRLKEIIDELVPIIKELIE
jgi:hypothetical protein